MEDKRAGKYSQLSDLEHAKLKTGMYLGNKEKVYSDEYIAKVLKSGSVEWVKKKRLCISPAAVKCFDEILVNAIDQNNHTNKRSNIWVNFDQKTGIVSIINDHSCIPTGVKQLKDKLVRIPQLLFGEFRTSSSYTDTIQTTGGTFGLGATLVNAFSRKFTVETLDLHERQLYTQTWSDCLTTTSEPVIIQLQPDNKDDTEYTKIEFELAYDQFGMTAEDLLDFERMLKMRVVHTAAVIKPASIHWNDIRIDINSVKRLTELYLPDDTEIYDQVITSSDNLQWHIAMACKASDTGFEQVSIVNGVYVKNGGTHIDFILDQIHTGIKEKYIALVKKLTKDPNPKFMKAQLNKHMFICFIGRIKGVSFNGQRKDEIDTPQNNYSGFKLSDTMIDTYWTKLLKPYVEHELLSKIRDKVKGGKVTGNKRVRAKKYIPAELAGGKSSASCSLFIAEGDSAISTIEVGLSIPKGPISSRTYGIYSIQGVPMNARTKISYEIDPITNERITIRKQQLKNNERLQVLVQILGLEYGRNYETPSDLSKLRYGRIIIATDQDEDGKGNIRSQLVNIFQTLWPGLVRLGYIYFIVTPVIRAYHIKGTETVKEFYTESEAKTWIDTINTKMWKIRYYKGLATHSRVEARRMFTKWDKMLMQYVADPDIEKTCEIYFGDNADLRKQVLVIPPEGTEEKYYIDNTVTVTNHMNTDTKAYQLYNIRRHLPNYIDGLLPSKRKVLCGAIQKLGRKNEQIKVVQLSGIVADKMNYHHGDASLNGVIVGMAQCFPGAQELPFLRALSNFGSRKRGGADAGHPRYIYTKLNRPLVNALFPRVDDNLLNWTFDDGQIGEPECYVPIVPLAILESYQSPGHGWSITAWSRDYIMVSNHVKKCITAGEVLPLECKDFKLSRHNCDYKVVNTDTGSWSIGTYTKVNDDSIIITGLPLRTWNDVLINGAPKSKTNKGWDNDPNIISISDRSDLDSQVEIHITFKPGFLDTLTDSQFDPIIKYLGLRMHITRNLNFICNNGTVIEFDTYYSVFKKWFGVRKDLYIARHTRMTELLKYKILLIENKIRFIDLRHGLKLNKCSRDRQIEILTEHKFQCIDQTTLGDPGLLKNSELSSIIKGPGASLLYLLKMSSIALSSDSREKLTVKLQSLTDELNSLKKEEIFPGSKMWIEELTTLDSIVHQGHTQGWDSWDVKPKWD